MIEDMTFEKKKILCTHAHIRMALWFMDFLGHSLFLEAMAYLQGGRVTYFRPFPGKRRLPSVMEAGPFQQGQSWEGRVKGVSKNVGPSLGQARGRQFLSASAITIVSHMCRVLNL